MKRLQFLIIAMLAIFLMACSGETQEENGNYLENNNQDYNEAQDWGDYPIIVNGVGIVYNLYTADGYDLPTHVSLYVTQYLDLMEHIGAGSQTLLRRNEEFSIEFNMLNYLAFGDDRVAVGADDAFMAEENFEVFIPISLLRELGFAAYFEGGHVFIYDESAMR